MYKWLTKTSTARCLALASKRTIRSRTQSYQVNRFRTICTVCGFSPPCPDFATSTEIPNWTKTAGLKERIRTNGVFDMLRSRPDTWKRDGAICRWKMAAVSWLGRKKRRLKQLKPQPVQIKNAVVFPDGINIIYKH